MKRSDLLEGPFGRVAKGFASGFDAGKDSPDALNKAVGKALNPNTYGNKGTVKKAEWKPIPVKPVQVNPNKMPKSLKDVQRGASFKSPDGKLYQWAGQQWMVKTPSGKWQAGTVDSNKAFTMYLDAIKNNKAYEPKKESIMNDVNEGLGDLAHRAEADHEVQMARAELYKLAKYAIKLHDMLKGVSEAEGLDGWVQSKITKAANDIGSVYHHMDYEEASEESMPQPKMAEGKYKNDAQRKAVHAAKDAKKKKDETVYKSNLSAMLERKLNK